MDRCKVICHMMISIDGKIDGKFMDEPQSDPVGDYYEDWKNKNGKAWGNGSNTHAKYFGYHDVDYSVYDTESIDYSDHVIVDEDHNYIVTFDTRGKCNWISNTVNYFGESKNLMVLSQNAPKSYLAHLRALEIPYIIAGIDKIDLETALVKLKSLFGIETLVICGGAVINGAFFSNGLVDEISLVVTPYVEGDSSSTVINTAGAYNNGEYKFMNAIPTDGNGVHLRFNKA